MKQDEAYRILLVDDDSEIINLLEFHLKQGLDSVPNIEIFRCFSGNEAYELITSKEAEKNFHFIITGLQMPDGDAKVILDHIAQNHLCIPVSLCSSITLKEYEEINKQYPFLYNFVRKPEIFEPLQSICRHIKSVI